MKLKDLHFKILDKKDEILLFINMLVVLKVLKVKHQTSKKLNLNNSFISGEAL